jgi:hypothetical protein
MKSVELRKRVGDCLILAAGGEDGIRTHEALLEPTPLAGERLRPLGHLSVPAPIDGDSPIDKVFRGAMRFWLWRGSTGARSAITYDSTELVHLASYSNDSPHPR